MFSKPDSNKLFHDAPKPVCAADAAVQFTASGQSALVRDLCCKAAAFAAAGNQPCLRQPGAALQANLSRQWKHQ